MNGRCHPEVRVTEETLSALGEWSWKARFVAWCRPFGDMDDDRPKRKVDWNPTSFSAMLSAGQAVRASSCFRVRGTSSGGEGSADTLGPAHLSMRYFACRDRGKIKYG
jgi:hypothetical protein